MKDTYLNIAENSCNIISNILDIKDSIYQSLAFMQASLTI